MMNYLIGFNRVGTRLRVLLKTSMSSQQERFLKHLFQNNEFDVYDDSITNLSVGAPGPDLLLKACDVFRKATEHRMNIEAEQNAYMFQYGPTVGSSEIRGELASYLTKEYDDLVYSDNLIITTGATQGLHLILSTLLDTNGIIFVDDLTYMIALEVFQQFDHIEIVPVQLKESGVDTCQLRKVVASHRFTSKKKEFWGMYYTVPSFHNPTGILFSEDVCNELIQIARENDLLIACDDVYNLLYYGQRAPKRLFAYDEIQDENYKGNVISNCTFSKIIAPGIRLGWMECPPRCINILKNSGILKSGGCANQYTSAVVASMLQLGLAQSHIKMMSHHYNERMSALCSILKQHLPESCKFIQPSGGYFVWITLPDNIDAGDFNNFCRQHYQVCGIVGSTFSIDKSSRNCIRLAIAFHTKPVLENAAKRFCSAIKEYCNKMNV